MLGKSKWFKWRKYGGWGFWPSCWQGWLYLAILLSSFFLIQVLPLRSDWAKMWVMAAWAAVFAADAIHIFLTLPKDEREVIHEAKAERNALWAMILVLCAGVAYQVASGMVSGWREVDPVIFAALIAGVLVKAATNVYLDSKH